MAAINTYFINESKPFRPDQLKANTLRRHFNVPTNGMVAFVNTDSPDTLTFILERQCPPEAMACYNKLFLLSVQAAFPGIFEDDGRTLVLQGIPMAGVFYYFTKRQSLFMLSIFIRTHNSTPVVGHSKIKPKDFALGVLNQFKQYSIDVATTLKLCEPST